MKTSNNSMFKNVMCCIIFLALIILIFYLFNNYIKIVSNFTTNDFKEYTVKSKHADVVFRSNNSVMYVSIKYKNLAGLSAIHIHANTNGSPGPILAWLGTTSQWQHGVKQNTPGTNSPCCTRNNPNCTLVAPPGTPYLSKELENTEKYFIFYKKCNTNSCKSDCEWIENGTFLVSHGFNFQQLYDGVLTKAPPGPGIDVIEALPFTPYTSNTKSH
jgi:hypothetical protein